jgi:hypothetical protein
MGEYILKGDMNWKTWLIKGVKKAATVGVAAFLNEFARYVEVSELPTEYVAVGGIVVAILLQVENLIKHAKW